MKQIYIFLPWAVDNTQRNSKYGKNISNKKKSFATTATCKSNLQTRFVIYLFISFFIAVQKCLTTLKYGNCQC